MLPALKLGSMEQTEEDGSPSHAEASTLQDSTKTDDEVQQHESNSNGGVR